MRIRDSKNLRSILGTVSSDMSGIEQLQEELVRSEEKYRTILEEMDQGYYEIDLKGTLTFINDAAARMHGYTRQEMLGMKYKQFTPPQYWKSAVENYSGVLTTGIPMRGYSTVSLKKDGTLISREDSIFPIRDEKGKIVGLRGITRDVTQGKIAEEALLQEKKFTEAVIDSLTGIFFLIDKEGLFVRINKNGLEILGYTAEEAKHVNFMDVIAEEERAMVNEELPEVFTRGTADIELKLVTKGGRKIPYYLYARLVKLGDQEYLLGTGMDISKRLEAERARDEIEKNYRLLAENTSDIVSILDLDLHTVWVSSSYTRSSGFTLEDAQTLPVERLFPPQAVEKMTELFTKAFEDEMAGRAGPDRHWDMDAEAYRKDGSTHWLEHRLQFIRDEQGKPTAVMIQGRDITDRKRAEQARDESEKNYRLLAENTTDMVMIMDMDMKINWVTVPNGRSSGFTREEMQNLPIEKQLAPESLKKSYDILVEAFEDEKAGRGAPDRHYDAELEVYSKDGSTFWTENTFKFIRDEQGKAVAMLMQGRDITDRKLAEQARDVSERNYRLLAENTTDIISIIDEKLDLVWLSASGQKATGFSFEEQKNMPLKKKMTPASAKAAMALWARSVQEESSGNFPPDRTYNIESEYYCKDGSTIWVDTTLRFLRDENGKPLNMLLQGRDITARKLAEQARDVSERNYRLLAEHTSDIVTILDTDFNLIWMSASGEKLTGFTFEEQKNMPFKDKLTPESMKKSSEIISRAMQEEKEGTYDPDRHYDIESELYRKDGSTIWTETRISFIRDVSGKAVKVLLQGRDITDRKNAEVALQKSMEDLKRSNEELQRFAYVASHDLQEPLRMVSSYVQLLEKRYKDKLDDDAGDFIAYAVSGAKRMQNLINDLLSYSRVGTRGKPFAPVDCSEVLYAAVSNLQVAIQENGAVISHDDLPQLVGDEGQLVQLFQNIIGNAVKFHGPEAPEVRIDAVLKGEYWQFSIKDNGIGIEPQYFERIFQVFQRLNGVEYPGTGIGLSIARKIVQRHGGEMWLESQPGRGSTFYFTIPRNAKGEYGI